MTLKYYDLKLYQYILGLWSSYVLSKNDPAEKKWKKEKLQQTMIWFQHCMVSEILTSTL